MKALVGRCHGKIESYELWVLATDSRFWSSVKLYQKSAADPPETMLELTATIDRIFHEAGLQPRIWSTGTTYDIALQRPLDAEIARAYAVRFFLVGLYARGTDLERMYFYNWGGTKAPIVLQPAGGSPTPAAIAVAQFGALADRRVDHLVRARAAVRAAGRC